MEIKIRIKIKIKSKKVKSKKLRIGNRHPTKRPAPKAAPKAKPRLTNPGSSGKMRPSGQKASGAAVQAGRGDLYEIYEIVH
jgi:hypothetical protein